MARDEFIKNGAIRCLDSHFSSGKYYTERFCFAVIKSIWNTNRYERYSITNQYSRIRYIQMWYFMDFRSFI